MNAEPVRLDPFSDLSKLRLSQDFAANLGVKKVLVAVPVRKPSAQQFVRVHPEEAYRLDTMVLELKDDRETYIVDQSLWPELAGELAPKTLLTAIDRAGNVFIWPVRLPGEDGRIDQWNRSAREAADLATRSWVRINANMSIGAYDVRGASGEFLDPKWPEYSFDALLRIAFKGRFINAADHPVLRKLRGEL